jgi:hypothetical protein
MNLKLNEDLIWSSDWAGDEVGYDDVLVVGHYNLAVEPAISFYINMENMKILEVMVDMEELGGTEVCC